MNILWILSAIVKDGHHRVVRNLQARNKAGARGSIRSCGLACKLRYPPNPRHPPPKFLPDLFLTFPQSVQGFFAASTPQGEPNGDLVFLPATPAMKLLYGPSLAIGVDWNATSLQLPPSFTYTKVAR